MRTNRGRLGAEPEIPTMVGDKQLGLKIDGNREGLLEVLVTVLGGDGEGLDDTLRSYGLSLFNPKMPEDPPQIPPPQSYQLAAEQR